MKILLLSHVDLNNPKPTGTGRSVYLKYKYFSKNNDVRYLTELSKEDIDWCDCIYIIQFQSVINWKFTLSAIQKPIYYESQSFWWLENKNSDKLKDLELYFCKNIFKKIFCYSLLLKEYFHSNDISAKKLFLTHPGFDINNFEFIVTYVGNFNSYQNIEFIIKLANENPHITFLLIGDYPKSLVCPNNVELIGYKKEKELHRLLKMSDIFLIPREINGITETMPGKFAEYIFYGKSKIISTPTSDIKTYLEKTFNLNEFNTEINKRYNNKKITLDKSIFNISNIANKILEEIKK